MTVAVQRQYTGTAQVAVYLAYAARAGSAFIDRALYLPGPGLPIRPGAGPPGCPAISRSPPSPPWPGK
jgi:hypothetical protein